MRKLKKIRICFENIECIEVPAKYIDRFCFNNIHNALVYRNQQVLELEIADYISIILKPKANLEHDEEWSANGKTLFERIMNFNDIASFELCYNNYSKPDKEISTLWHEEDEYTNRYQTTAMMKDGSLVVVINKKKTAKEFVIESEKQIKIDSENLMNMLFKNYRGYDAKIERDENGRLHGRIKNAPDLITFEADTLFELQNEFHTAVDAYYRTFEEGE